MPTKKIAYLARRVGLFRAVLCCAILSLTASCDYPRTTAQRWATCNLEGLRTYASMPSGHDYLVDDYAMQCMAAHGYDYQASTKDCADMKFTPNPNKAQCFKSST